MLYQIYETQRALLAPFSEFASATAKLYSHPLSPFTHVPLSQRYAAGLDLMLDHQGTSGPSSTSRGVQVEGVPVAVQEQVAIHKPFCDLLRFKRFTDDAGALDKMKNQPMVLVVAPPVGPPCHAAARHRAQPAAGPQGLHHPLDRRPPGAAGRRRIPPGTTWPMCRSSSATSARTST
jgi:poly-beta-hydroxyalkanoate depolymerase